MSGPAKRECIYGCFEIIRKEGLFEEQNRFHQHTNSKMFLMKRFTNIFCSTSINTKTEHITGKLSLYTFKIGLSYAFIPEFGWTNPCA
jgi:hypothetical protein